VSSQPVGCSIDAFYSPASPGQDTIAQSVAGMPDTGTHCAIPVSVDPFIPINGAEDQVFFSAQANVNSATGAALVPGDTIFSYGAAQEDATDSFLQGAYELPTSPGVCTGESFDPVAFCPLPSLPEGLTWLEQNVLWTLNFDLWGSAFSDFTGCQDNG